jgi:hypothetical protein
MFAVATIYGGSVHVCGVQANHCGGSVHVMAESVHLYGGAVHLVVAAVHVSRQLSDYAYVHLWQQRPSLMAQVVVHAAVAKHLSGA